MGNGQNQHAANLRNVLTHEREDIVQYIQDRITKTRGVMAVFIRPDGRVRVMRDELLDGTGKGVVGHFARHHTLAHIREKLDLFLASNEAYFDR